MKTFGNAFHVVSIWALIAGTAAAQQPSVSGQELFPTPTTSQRSNTPSALLRIAQLPAPPATAAAPGVEQAAAAGGASASPFTLWNFLGVPTADQMAEHQKVIDKLPLFQVLEAATKPLLGVVGLVPGPPPLDLPLSPDALKVPALEVAAEIKKQEDMVPQKIQAIKYLAKIGCDCYPGVRDALLKALDDCNEKVRREAIKAIEKSLCW